MVNHNEPSGIEPIHSDMVCPNYDCKKQVRMLGVKTASAAILVCPICQRVFRYITQEKTALVRMARLNVVYPPAYISKATVCSDCGAPVRIDNYTGYIICQEPLCGAKQRTEGKSGRQRELEKKAKK